MAMRNAMLLLLLCACQSVFVRGAEMPKLNVPFECHAEINYPAGKYSRMVDEYSEEFGNYHRIEHRKDFAVNTFIFDYPNEELYQIKDGYCQTAKLGNQEEHFQKLKYSIFTEEEENAISVAAFLKFIGDSVNVTKSSEAVEQETAGVRGVNVDCWKGAKDGLVFLVCWSNSDWSEVQESLPVPVAVFVEGNLTHNGRVIPVNLEVHVHLFLEGIAGDNPSLLFQTPEGLFCTNRKYTEDVPVFPEILSFHLETFLSNPGVTEIQNQRVVYDKNLNIVRIEQKWLGDPFYSLGTISIIFDYNTGITYYLDSTLGNCTKKTIDKNVNNKNLSSQNFFEMKEPNELFYIDGKYSYVGKKVLRGVPVDYFISKRTDFKFPAFDYLNTTFGIYLLDGNILDWDLGDGISVQSKVPMKLDISIYYEPDFIMDKATYQQTFNFFNFAAIQNFGGEVTVGEVPGWNYDIRSCFESVDEKHVRLVFNASGNTDLLKMENRLFRLAAMTKIKEILENGKTNRILSPLRLQDPEMVNDYTNVSLTFTILPKVDPKLQFIAWEGVVNLPSGGGSSVPATSDMDCIAKCLEKTDQLCQSANFCPLSKECTLYNKAYDTVDRTVGDCRYFTRAVENKGVDFSTEEIIQGIQNSVKSKLFTVVLPQPNSEEGVVYEAFDFLDDISRTPPEPTPDRSFPITGQRLKLFNRLNYKQIEASQVLHSQLMADECAQACLNDAASPSCVSFTYNFQQGICSLSVYDPKTSPDKVTNSSNSHVFTRNPVARFQQSAGKVKHQFAGGSVVNELTDCATACSAKCTTQEQCQCLTFDFCLRKNTNSEGIIDNLENVCFLSQLREPKPDYDEINPNEKTIECDRYTKTYDSDFQFVFHRNNVPLNKYSVKNRLSDGECANECVEKGLDCKGFFYCRDGSNNDCAPVMASQDENEIDQKGQIYCGYNKRVLSFDGTKYSPPSSSKPQDTSTVTVGLAVGLVITFFVLGCVLAALGMYSYSKMQNKNSSSDVIHYST